jgi:hypothetical protein
MNLLLEWWRDLLRLHVHFGKPCQERELLQLLQEFRGACKKLQQSNETTRRALALAEDSQAKLARARAELAAYKECSLDVDAQVEKLEWMMKNA